MYCSEVDEDSDYYDTINSPSLYLAKAATDEHPTVQVSGSTTASMYNGSLSYPGSLLKVTTTATGCVD